MNRISGFDRLKNRYYALRHGESRANLSVTVCGDPKVGIDNYGLTPNGRKQVRESVKNFKGLDSEVLIYSSDFLRAKQTAKIVAETLGIGLENLVLESGLRERFFGQYEKLAGFDYNSLYKQEKKGTLNNDVETTESILLRTTQVIADLENKYEKKKIILVSHGDPIMILEAAFLGMDVSHYRQLPYIHNGAIRPLILIPTIIQQQNFEIY